MLAGPPEASNVLEILERGHGDLQWVVWSFGKPQDDGSGCIYYGVLLLLAYRCFIDRIGSHRAELSCVGMALMNL
jgi:hypothetical protein